MISPLGGSSDNVMVVFTHDCTHAQPMSRLRPRSHGPTSVLLATIVLSPVVGLAQDLRLNQIHSWGTDRSAPDRLHEPVAVAFGNDSVYVLDGRNRRVVETDLEGQLIRTFGEGELELPVDLAVDPSGDILLLEEFALHRYDRFGAVVEGWGAPTVSIPEGRSLAIDSSGEILVGTRDGRLLRLDPSGATLATTRTCRQLLAILAIPVEGQRDDLVVACARAGSPGTVLRLTADGQVLATLAGSGIGPGLVLDPRSLARGPGGEIHIVECSHEAAKVIELDHQGVLIREWGETGTAPGRLYSPTGLAITPSGERLIVDGALDRVSRFAPDGRFLATWGGGDSGPGSLNGPSGLAFDTDGTLLVVDQSNSRIQRFQRNGTFLASYGRYGTGPGELRSPTTVAIDPRDQSIWVTDTGNHRIQKLSRRGDPLVQVGRYGSAPAEFASPVGIGVGRDGTVFVADTGNQRVQRFDALGRPEHQWRTDPGLVTPMGAAVDATGHVIVGTGFSFGARRYTADGRPAPGYYGLPGAQQAVVIALDERGYVLVGGLFGGVLRSPLVGTFTDWWRATDDRSGRTSVRGLAVGPDGYLYTTVSGSDRIYKSTPPCDGRGNHLCLTADRFRVEVDWQNSHDGSRGHAWPIAVAGAPATAGHFTFSDPDNVELMVKIVDFGDEVKVFYSQLTDLDFQIYVTETSSGRREVYGPTRGNCGAIDADAFSESGQRVPGASLSSAQHQKSAGTCLSTTETLCLLDGRFAASVTWRNPYLAPGAPGSTGLGLALPLDPLPGRAALSGQFAFDAPANIEILVKTLDFGNDDILVLYGSLSDFEYTLTVRETATDRVATFHNPAGTYCGGFDRTTF